jgi:hypothetical protein
MTSRERILAALTGRAVDHVPLTTWCFGLPAPQHLRWSRDGIERAFWYSLRMEHLHRLPQPWTLDDDFRRVETWQSLGIDDLLDVSVPWDLAPNVTYRDSLAPAGQLDTYPVFMRDYETPDGPIHHAVRQTGEDVGAGWVIQPDCVPIIEDYNIPRAIDHAVRSAQHVPALRHLYAAPNAASKQWFADRMQKVRTFADAKGVFVQAWTAFGMDAAVWFCGTDGAVMLAMDDPDAFDRLVHQIADTDAARTELAASTSGIDMVCQRGWYSSTDFWSPKLFDQFVFPHVQRLASIAHKHGKKFGYVMTTGVETLGPRLADAGVDLVYFVDPIQDRFELTKARDLLGHRITLVGGTNALSLGSAGQGFDRSRLEREIRSAIDILKPTKRFILHPIDALFPDTPWAGVEAMIELWKKYR